MDTDMKTIQTSYNTERERTILIYNKKLAIAFYFPVNNEFIQYRVVSGNKSYLPSKDDKKYKEHEKLVQMSSYLINKINQDRTFVKALGGILQWRW